MDGWRCSGALPPGSRNQGRTRRGARLPAPRPHVLFCLADSTPTSAVGCGGGRACAGSGGCSLHLSMCCRQVEWLRSCVAVCVSAACACVHKPWIGGCGASKIGSGAAQPAGQPPGCSFAACHVACVELGSALRMYPTTCDGTWAERLPQSLQGCKRIGRSDVFWQPPGFMGVSRPQAPCACALALLARTPGGPWS